MTKHMLIDATHSEETRVVVMNGKHIDDYDVETSSRRQLKGNIYLAKVIRVEPSLQAAFVDYGGNRHGFLAFSEIHPDYFRIPAEDRERLLALQEEEQTAEQNPARTRPAGTGDEEGDAWPESSPDHGDDPEFAAPAPVGNHAEGDDDLSGEGTEDGPDSARQAARFLKNYRIQEVIRRRQILLVQVVKEERGGKGAALTTYISLAGRYCVLMPNTLRGGGVSRKITSESDRKRLRDIINHLELPRSMAMIIRTAGAGRPGPEIVRDCDYLLQLWDDIRTRALNSIAPELVYEEASLIKRAIRDLFARDIEDIIIDGEAAWKLAREFTRQLMPHNASKVKAWQNRGHSLFSHYNVEHHLDEMFSPVVHLESGGYLVINQTEALVAIDVNSGKSTAQRNIEDTALRTNLEAADEVARQLRLRDLAGLIVIDFIDMESSRNNARVEKRLKDALRLDRARIQIGRISHFGLLEMSRQRLRPSLAETVLSPCPHCQGTGNVRGIESTALHVLRLIEEEAARHRRSEIMASIAPDIALYMLNHKRDSLTEIEARHQVVLMFRGDEGLAGARVRLDHADLPQDQALPAGKLPSGRAALHKIEIMEGTAPMAVASGQTPSEEALAVLPAEDRNSDEDGQAHEARHQENGRRNNRRRRGGRNRRNGGRDGEAILQDISDDAASHAESANHPDDEVETDETGLMPGRKRTRTRRKAPQDAAEPDMIPDMDATSGTNAENTTEQPARERRGRGRQNRDKLQTAPVPNHGRKTDIPAPEAEKPGRAAAMQNYRGPTPANPFAGFNIFDTIEETMPHYDAPAAAKAPAQETSAHTAVMTDVPEREEPHEALDQEEQSRKPPRRRGRKPATPHSGTRDGEAAPVAQSAAEENASVEAQPADNKYVRHEQRAENTAAPRPVNIDEITPDKRRVGWWNH